MTRVEETGEHMDAMLNASASTIARVTKPILADWANTIRPILNEPNDPNLHARLVQATASTVECLKQVSYITSKDGFAGMSSNFQAATKDLNKDFPGFSDQFYWGYTFGLSCRDGKVDPVSILIILSRHDPEPDGLSVVYLTRRRLLWPARLAVEITLSAFRKRKYLQMSTPVPGR